MNISNSQVNRLRHFVRAGLRSLFRPEPQTAVEWADANYYLPKESAYQEGRWETLPFQRAIMNAMGSDYIREVNVVKSARVGYTYTLRENGMPYAGVIAQEVMEAIPEAVGSFTHYGEELQGPTVDGNELREETRYLNVDYAAVTGLLVQVARETDGRVTALEEENITLRKNLATAGTRISTLENQVSELVALVRQLTGSEH